MAKQLTDEELNLRRKLRRRLIGAAALTLAVVVILPMVLDSEPKSTGEDIELRIPAPDKVGEFVPGKETEEVVDTSASAANVVASSAVSAVPQTVSAATPSLRWRDVASSWKAPRYMAIFTALRRNGSARKSSKGMTSCWK